MQDVEELLSVIAFIKLLICVVAVSLLSCSVSYCIHLLDIRYPFSLFLPSSTGFCLLNNVAIGAAYARYTYGRQGKFKRIAIIDFDIHHGNGTEEIVKALRPQKRVMPLPASWAPIHYEQYKPWLSDDDHENVFFGSINLVDGVQFYPCSGRAEDNDYGEYPNIVNVELTPIKVVPPPPG